MNKRDLIARLEAATGPSYELDIEIAKMMLPTEMFGSKAESWFNTGHVFGCNTADGYRHLEVFRAPAYTASLDAALTMVPEHKGRSWYWRVGSSSLYRGWASLDKFHPDHNDKRNEAFACAATPALALCIAILRAMEANDEQA